MLLEILQNSEASIPYAAITAFKHHAPGSFILATTDGHFNWERYWAAGLCSATPKDGYLAEGNFSWQSQGEKIIHGYRSGLFEIRWQGHLLELLQLQYSASCGSTTWMALATPQESVARAFFAAVCQWSVALREEVYVYEEGYWNKDADLYKSIQSSRLENLILPPGLKEAIRDDVAAYFAAKDRYAQFNVPWKRGLIFIGPPGNGKTHMIKALINDLNKPCLYVKSLKSRYQNEDRSIREVFDQARESAPCFLILEDIDALIDSENRSFFLNELDGFRKNDGILTLATTNHPEKLDPAIIDRPSRFDRKYHFELPAEPERATYLRWWNQQFDPALRLSEEGISALADQTGGFSFAYLKELALAATMAWMANQRSPMDEVMQGQLKGLREQMDSHKVLLPPTEAS